MAGQNETIGGGGFHHVAIKTADFEKTVAFYTQALGFVERVRWGEGDGRAIMLDCGDGNYFEIFAGGKVAEGEKGKPAAGDLVHVALRSEDVDGAIAAAKAGGATITVEPKDVAIPSTPPMNVRIAFCKAPGGETIEFFKHLD